MDPLHVLVMARDPAHRIRLAAPLRSAGMVVVEAADPEEAAVGLREAAPDAVVLDLAGGAIDPARLGELLAPEAALPPESLEAVEVRHIRQALIHTDGNRRQAALLLGISRSTLLAKIRRYGL